MFLISSLIVSTKDDFIYAGFPYRGVKSNQDDPVMYLYSLVGQRVGQSQLRTKLKEMLGS